MQNSKLIQVLRTFSKEEWKEYEKLVASPFFNKGRNLLPFVREMKKFHPEFNSSKLTREFIYSKVYRGKSYNNNTMKSALTSLLDMAEEYIKQISLRNYSGFMNSFCSYESNYRRLDFLTVKYLASANKIIESYKIDNHYFMMKLYYQLGQLSKNLHFDRQKLVCDDVIIYSKLNIYYFLSSVQLSLNNLKANDTNYNSGFENTLAVSFLRNINFKKIIPVLEKYEDEYTIPVKIYIYIIACYLDPNDDESFAELKKLTFGNLDRFNSGEKHVLADRLELICKLRVKSGSPESKDITEITRFIMNNNLYKYSAKEFFPAIKFFTYFNTYITNKEYKLADRFIDKYSTELNPEVRDDLVKYCSAAMSFEKKEYDKVLEYFKHVNPTIFLDKFDIRNLQLKLYFERNYTEESLSILDTYGHFLSHNKDVSDSMKLPNQNFIKYYRQLIKIKMRDFTNEPQLLENEISKEINVSSKAWLLEKLNELEDKKK
jgi:hypothetical protein